VPHLDGDVVYATDSHGMAGVTVRTSTGHEYVLTTRGDVSMVVEDQIAAGAAHRVPPWLIERETGVDAAAIRVLHEQLGSGPANSVGAIVPGCTADFSVSDAIAEAEDLRRAWFGETILEDGDGLVFELSCR